MLFWPVLAVAAAATLFEDVVTVESLSSPPTVVSTARPATPMVVAVTEPSMPWKLATAPTTPGAGVAPVASVFWVRSIVLPTSLPAIEELAVLLLLTSDDVSTLVPATEPATDSSNPAPTPSVVAESVTAPGACPPSPCTCALEMANGATVEAEGATALKDTT